MKTLGQKDFKAIKVMKEGGETYAGIANMYKESGYTTTSGRALTQADISHFMIANGYRLLVKKGKKRRTKITTTRTKLTANAKTTDEKIMPLLTELIIGLPTERKTQLFSLLVR